ncbi:hypothetical protein TRVA0_003S02520 [Trichomonascus vanleenenianus]|uniref:uncharacterized protein n=1 Tax=Trichomonascus vanleenenianus TaxID=2268995 RepID=UPI003EC98E21
MTNLVHNSVRVPLISPPPAPPSFRSQSFFGMEQPTTKEKQQQLKEDFDKSPMLANGPSSPTSVTGGGKGPPTPTEPSPQIYNEDDGVIRCVCGFDDDDGFTIQCEKCYVWQHAQCVNITTDAVPDIYYCEQCEKRPVDVARAIQLQTARIERERLALTQDQQPIAVIEEEAAAAAPPPAPTNNNARRRRRTKAKSPSSSNNDLTLNDNGDTTAMYDDSNNSSNLSPKSVATNTPAPSATTTTATATATTTANSRRGGRRKVLTVQESQLSLDDGNESDAEPDSRYYSSPASYNLYFIKADECRFANDRTARHFSEKIHSLCEDDANCSFLSLQEFQKIKPAKVAARMVKDQHSKKFMGFSQYGLFLESANSVPRDRFIIEFMGSVTLVDDYIRNPINQYFRCGCPKQGVLFLRHLGVAIDGRQYGNEARVIRQSCTPNLKFSPVVVEGQTMVRFAAFATEIIKPDQELTIGWQWDPHHPVRKLEAGEKLTPAEKDCIRRTAEELAKLGMACACEHRNTNKCLIKQMKKLVVDDSASKADVGGSGDSNGKASVSGYSAREERKLREAMELIEKLEKKESSRKRKLQQQQSEESFVDGPLDEEPANGGDEGNDVEPVAPKPEMVSRAVQTEVTSETKSVACLHVYDPAKIAVLPRARIIRRYLSIREEYKVNPQRFAMAPPPCSYPASRAGSPPSPSSRRTTESYTPVSASTSPKPAQAPSVEATVVATSSVEAVAVEVKDSVKPPPAKKKLTFADYKKKMSQK